MVVDHCTLIGKLAAVALLLGVQGVGLSADPTEPVPGVLLETDVSYGTGGGVPLHMDIARPKTADGPLPAVVFIHGGGWRGGDKAAFRGALLGYAKAGYVAVSVQYRFAPAHKWPAQIEDVKCAVRYLRGRAKELNIDSERIGAAGGSAGGHLALLLGTTHGRKELEGTGGHAEFSSRVSAVASIAGPTDFEQVFPPLVEVMIQDLLGGTRPGDSAVNKNASPIHHLTPDDAPLLAIHGTADELVPYAQATSLTQACKEKGIDASLITIENGGHGFGGDPAGWHSANLKMLAFFDHHLKHKPSE